MRCGPAISAAILFASFAQAQNKTSAPPPNDELRPRADEAFRAQVREWNPQAAQKELGDVLLAAAASREGHAEGLVTSAAHRRCITLLAAADDVTRARLLAFLADNVAVERTLAFLLKPADKPAKVAEIFDALCAAKPAAVQRLPALAAAVAVTHDVRYRDPQVPEIKTAAPAAYFDYFTANAGALAFKLDRTPPELLIYVVNVTAPVTELNWARARYSNRPRIGQVYFDVAYDYGFLTGGPKATERGGDYTLESLRKFGGICSDQAYYANQCGKALGVPTVVVSAPGSTVGHAWIGYLFSGSATAWDFDSGRYDEFKGVAGEIRDPQTGRTVTDARVKLSARLAGSAPMDRWRAVALTDAARILLADKDADVARALDWLEAAVNACPAMTDAWDAIADIARADQLPQASRLRWSDAVLRLCGKDSPDFALEVLVPMIRSVKDPADQSKAWDWAFDHFVRPVGDQSSPRWDLAAHIKIAQGAMWERAGDPVTALAAYQLVIDKLSGEGPYGLDAAIRAAAILDRNHRPPMEIAEVFAKAWHKAQHPEKLSDTFRTSTPWYRLGVLYADALEKAGKKSEAVHVRKQIKFKADKN